MGRDLSLRQSTLDRDEKRDDGGGDSWDAVERAANEVRLSLPAAAAVAELEHKLVKAERSNTALKRQLATVQVPYYGAITSARCPGLPMIFFVGEGGFGIL